MSVVALYKRKVGDSEPAPSGFLRGSQVRLPGQKSSQSFSPCGESSASSCFLYQVTLKNLQPHFMKLFWSFNVEVYPVKKLSKWNKPLPDLASSVSLRQWDQASPSSLSETGYHSCFLSFTHLLIHTPTYVHSHTKNLYTHICTHIYPNPHFTHVYLHTYSHIYPLSYYQPLEKQIQILPPHSSYYHPSKQKWLSFAGNLLQQGHFHKHRAWGTMWKISTYLLCRRPLYCRESISLFLWRNSGSELL